MPEYPSVKAGGNAEYSLSSDRSDVRGLFYKFSEYNENGDNY